MRIKGKNWDIDDIKRLYGIPSWLYLLLVGISIIIGIAISLLKIFGEI